MTAATLQFCSAGKISMPAMIGSVYYSMMGCLQFAPAQAYGMATWDCFRKAPDKGGLQLQRIVKLAQGVAGPDHGFRCSPR